MTQASSIAYLVLCLIITGIGQRLFQSPNAVAGAVFTSFGGAAADAALAAGREALSVEHARALQQTFVTGLRAAFVVCAVLGALGVVTSLLRGAEGVVRPPVPGAQPDGEGPTG